MARRTEQVLRRLTRDGAGTLRMLCDDTAEARGLFVLWRAPGLGAGRPTPPLTPGAAHLKRPLTRP